MRRAESEPEATSADSRPDEKNNASERQAILSDALRVALREHARACASVLSDGGLGDRTTTPGSAAQTVSLLPLNSMRQFAALFLQARHCFS